MTAEVFGVGVVSAPRPWGCSARHRRPGGRRAVRPTPVGMFRRRPRWWRRRRVRPTPVGMFRSTRPTRISCSGPPHARGDVPRTGAPRSPSTMSAPRPWGCSGLQAAPGAARGVRPTPVGMFRSATPPPMSRPCPPHARGDVPVLHDLPMGAGESAPRPWGCSGPTRSSGSALAVRPTPVGMFRLRRPPIALYCRPPHARGDVPHVDHVVRGHAGVRPTPVGMFRPWPASAWARRGPPHARGDVPCAISPSRSLSTSAPRPWGCSGRFRGLPGALRVRPMPVGMFRPAYWNGAGRACPPTPVGMFRPRRTDSSRSAGPPHARGDVPKARQYRRIWVESAPRPWGCSAAPVRGRAGARVRPTPVGMFRTSLAGAHRTSRPPHARGDVPAITTRPNPVLTSAPHTWGCSDRAGPGPHRTRVCPAHVRMLRPPAGRGCP